MMQGTQVGHLTDIRKVFVDPVMDNATRAIEEKAVESQAAFVKYLDPVACVTERAVVFCFLQCACNGTGNGNIVDYDEAMTHRTVPDAPPALPDLCDGTGMGKSLSFNIAPDKASGCKLDITCDVGIAILRITDVAGGLVGQWNAKCPAPTVCRGDISVVVYGKRKGPQMQFDACKQNRMLSLLVLRVQRRAYASSLLPHPPCLYVVSGWGG